MVFTSAKNKLIQLYKKNYNPPHAVKFYINNGFCFYTNITSRIMSNDTFYTVPKFAKKFSLDLYVFLSDKANSNLIPTFRITFYDSNRKKVYVMLSQRFRQSKRYRFMKQARYYQIDICAFKLDKSIPMDSDCEFEIACNAELDELINADDTESVIYNASMDRNSNYSSSDSSSSCGSSNINEFYENYSQEIDNVPTTASINDDFNGSKLKSFNKIIAIAI